MEVHAAEMELQFVLTKTDRTKLKVKTRQGRNQDLRLFDGFCAFLLGFCASFAV